MNKIDKPAKTEYPAYAAMYINLVPDDGLVLQHLSENFKKMQYLVLSLTEESLLYRYSEGKWTIKEMLAHIIDDERIYVYRALRFARNDRTELPGFDQDDYALYSGANERSAASLLEEYESVRKATSTFFNNLPDDAFFREGVANRNKYSVRALVYHITGHELHHMQQINKYYLK